MIICTVNEEQKREVTYMDTHFPITSRFDNDYIQDMTNSKKEMIEQLKNEVITIVSLYGESEETYRDFQTIKEENHQCKIITFAPDKLSKEERKRMETIADIIITFAPASENIEREMWKHAYTLLSMSEFRGFVAINSMDIKGALQGHTTAHVYSLPLFQAKQKEETMETFQMIVEQTDMKKKLEQAKVVLVQISSDVHFTYEQLDAMTECIHNYVQEDAKLCIQLNSMDADKNGEIEVNMIMN